MFTLLLVQCEGGEKTGASGLGKDSKESFRTMREKMVETQIKARGVKAPRVLTAMLKVERHFSVPAENQSFRLC